MAAPASLPGAVLILSGMEGNVSVIGNGCDPLEAFHPTRPSVAVGQMRHREVSRVGELGWTGSRME